MFTRSKTMPVPEVGEEAPEFNLPSAQGGQLRLSMRTVRGPVVVAFYRPWSEEDVAYFKELAEKEDEINLAAGSVAAIGVAEPDVAREFARATGLKSYVLYDYARVTSRQWGLFEREKKRGDYARPAVFIVGPEGNVVHAWNEDRPDAAELLAKVSEITGLPKPAEEPADAAEEPGKDAAASEGSAPKKLTAEEREKIKAERRAAREAGQSVKTPQAEKPAESGAGSNAEDGPEDGAPKKMSREERERIKAERRAARESGQSLKSPRTGEEAKTDETDEPGAGAPESGAPKKMSREERERIKAERRAAREAGQSLKTGGESPKTGEDSAPNPESEAGAKAGDDEQARSESVSESEQKIEPVEAGTGENEASDVEPESRKKPDGKRGEE